MSTRSNSITAWCSTSIGRRTTPISTSIVPALATFVSSRPGARLSSPALTDGCTTASPRCSPTLCSSTGGQGTRSSLTRIVLTCVRTSDPTASTGVTTAKGKAAATTHTRLWASPSITRTGTPVLSTSQTSSPRTTSPSRTSRNATTGCQAPTARPTTTTSLSTKGHAENMVTAVTDVSLRHPTATGMPVQASPLLRGSRTAVDSRTTESSGGALSKGLATYTL